MSQFMVSREQWDSTPVPQRSINCHFVGLEGKVAGKEWDQVTSDERLALSGVTGLATQLGAKTVEFEINNQAMQEFRDKTAASMRSVAGDIVAKALGGAK